MKRTESKEMYLEVIYDIYLSGDDIRSIDVANRLGYSKPSVNRGMNLLKEAGLITQQPYGAIMLTDEGIKVAKDIKERHNMLTIFLQKTLNLDEQTAEHDACRIEHVISDEAMEKIKELYK